MNATEPENFACDGRTRSCDAHAHLGRVRLIEPHVLGHGPLWLDYMAGAFASVCDELTVIHPRHASYSGLEAAAQRWRARGRCRIELESVALDVGRDRMPAEWTLARACEPGVDVSLVTFVDQTVWGPRHLRHRVGAPRSAIWGVWFSVVDPANGFARRLRALHSPLAQWERRCTRAQASPPAWLDGAFFLDRSFADRVALRGDKRVLPELWRTRPRMERAAMRERLGLPLDATIFLHFGTAEPRKGLRDCIEAWQRVKPPAFLFRLGEVAPRDQPGMRRLVEAGRAMHHPGWIPEDLADAGLRASDWVLLPYRRHAGSSGVLSAAAAARRPVIAADYGLIGERVRRDGLGLSFEHESVAALAAAVGSAAQRDGSAYAPALDRFAAARTIEAFERALLAPFVG